MRLNPPAAEVLANVRAQLGQPKLVVVDAPYLPPRLKPALVEAGPGGLVAVVVKVDLLADVASRLLRQGGAEVRRIEVAEGHLVLAHRTEKADLGRRAMPAPPPWDTRDARPVLGARPCDLDDPTVLRLLRKASPGDRRAVPGVGSNEDRFLASYGVAALDGATWRPTLAAMVLAGRRAALHVPACAVVGVVDGEALDLRGTIPDILNRLHERWPPGVHRHVICQAVLNALLHRDWTVDAPVELHLDGGRLTVTNLGAIGSAGPNPLLVHLARELGVARGIRRGLLEVDALLGRHGLPAHSLFESTGRVRFVADLPVAERVGQAVAPIAGPQFAPVPRSLPPPNPPTPPGGDALSHSPPLAEPPVPVAPTASPPSLLPRDRDARVEAVLSALRAKGQATCREVAAVLGCSRPVVGKVLTMLVAEGRVRCVASASNSPFQSYGIADAEVV